MLDAPLFLPVFHLEHLVPEPRHLRRDEPEQHPLPLVDAASARRARSPAAAPPYPSSSTSRRRHLPGLDGQPHGAEVGPRPVLRVEDDDRRLARWRRHSRDVPLRFEEHRLARSARTCLNRSPTSSYTASTEQPVTESCGPFCSSSFHACRSSPRVGRRPSLMLPSSVFHLPAGAPTPPAAPRTAPAGPRTPRSAASARSASRAPPRGCSSARWTGTRP